MARDLNPNVYLTLILIVMLMDIIFLLLFTPLMLTFSPKRQISCCYRCRIIEFSIAFSFKMFLTGVCSCMMSHLSLSEYMIFFGGNRFNTFTILIPFATQTAPIVLFSTVSATPFFLSFAILLS